MIDGTKVSIQLQEQYTQNSEIVKMPYHMIPHLHGMWTNVPWNSIKHHKCTVQCTNLQINNYKILILWARYMVTAMARYSAMQTHWGWCHPSGSQQWPCNWSISQQKGYIFHRIMCAHKLLDSINTLFTFWARQIPKFTPWSGISN
jgi:hypothetical protein